MQAETGERSRVSGPVEGPLRRAVAGDQAVLPELRAVLQQPEVVDILGNLAHRVEVALVDHVTGNDLAFREALTLKLAAMRAELADPDASPLERQVVERVVLACLSLHEAEYRMADARHPIGDGGRLLATTHRRMPSEVLGRGEDACDRPPAGGAGPDQPVEHRPEPGERSSLRPPRGGLLLPASHLCMSHLE
jgi:hypothetical protein